MSIDRLSALPDFLLIRVLGLLKLKEAVITSLLSKRWRSLWADLPRLFFLDRKALTVGKLVSLVRTALVRRTLNYLEGFLVQFKYDECYASDVDFWLEFVANYKTKFMILQLCSAKHFYELPQMMYFNSSLEYVSLQRCILAPRNTIDWPSLKSLEIADAELPQNVIEKILSNCPVLHSLILHQCWGFSRLEIKSQKLGSLEIEECLGGKSRAPLLEISAPYLECLNISWRPKGRKLHLRNISSLLCVKLEFYLCGEDDSTVEILSAVRQLLEQVQHVQKLTLGSDVLKIVSRMVESGRQLPLSSAETLRLDVTASGGDPEQGFSGVVGLLESSPKLECLSLYSGSFSLTEDITWGAAAMDDLVRDLYKLKTVVMLWFGRTIEPLLTMAQILLKRAIVLEKMEICLPDCSPACLAETTQKLQSYPRSSQKLIISSTGKIDSYFFVCMLT